MTEEREHEVTEVTGARYCQYMQRGNTKAQAYSSRVF